MMNLTVRNRIIVSFLLIIAILVLLAGASYVRLVQIEKEANGIRNGSIPGLYHPSKAQELWSRHMLDTRRLLLRAVDEDVAIVLDTYRDQFATLEQALDEEFGRYQSATADEQELALAEQFRQVQLQYLNRHGQLLDSLPSIELKQARQLSAERVFPEWDKGESLLSELIEMNRSQAEIAAHEIRGAVRIMEAGLLIAILGVETLGVFVGDDRQRDLSCAVGEREHLWVAAMRIGKDGALGQRNAWPNDLQQICRQVLAAVQADPCQQIGRVPHVQAVITAAGA